MWALLPDDHVGKLLMCQPTPAVGTLTALYHTFNLICQALTVSLLRLCYVPTGLHPEATGILALQRGWLMC